MDADDAVCPEVSDAELFHPRPAAPEARGPDARLTEADLALIRDTASRWFDSVPRRRTGKRLLEALQDLASRLLASHAAALRAHPDLRLAAQYLSEYADTIPARDLRTPIVQLAARLRAHPAAGGGERDTSHRLAMLALQSERYQSDVDYREAVDDVLAWTMPRTPTGGHRA